MSESKETKIDPRQQQKKDKIQTILASGKTCPHHVPPGKLIPAPESSWHRHQVICQRCGRGWNIQDNGDWWATGTAGFEAYDTDGNIVY